MPSYDTRDVTEGRRKVGPAGRRRLTELVEFGQVRLGMSRTCAWSSHCKLAPPMRSSLVIVVLAASSDLATACPEAVPTEVVTDDGPTTIRPCQDEVDFSQSRRVFEARYVVGAGGLTRSGIGSTASAFAGLDLSYHKQFGSDPEQPSYEFELTAGAALHHTNGDVKATGLTTRGGLRLGPSRVTEALIDEGRANFAAIPTTMEIAHTGEIAARPRMSARPELARAQYHRERVELATRILRVEGAGTKAQTVAPGLTQVRKPSSWAIDIFPLHSGVDIAMQDSTRFDTTIGGAMMGVVEHNTGTKVDLLGVEYRRVDLAMTGPAYINTVWMLKLDGVDPNTGSQYYMGWGQLIWPEELHDFAYAIDPEAGELTIGGIGWYSKMRNWGNFGLQYKREPYVTMTGTIGLEDRFSGEVYVPRALGLVARTFVARTMHMAQGTSELESDVTAGIEVDASYTRAGFTSKLGFEVGRTYYTALDATLPETTGFAMALDLTIQHSGARAWTRSR